MSWTETVRTAVTALVRGRLYPTATSGTTTMLAAPSELPATVPDDDSDRYGNDHRLYPGFGAADAQFYLAATTLAQTRQGWYREYDEMDEELPEFASALNIYADNVTRASMPSQPALRVITENPRAKRIIEELFRRIEVEHILYEQARDIAKYGERAEEVVLNKDFLVERLKPLPTAFVIPQTDDQGRRVDPAWHQVDAAGQPLAKLREWQVLHFANFPSRAALTGRGVGYSARKAFKQLRMTEDAIVLGRLTRAHNRFAFLVDTEGMTPVDAQKHIDKVKQKMRKKRVVDPRTGRMDLASSPLSVEEDLFVATRPGSNADVKVLQGDLTAGNVEDISYLQQKIFTGLQVPKAFLQQAGDAKSRGIVTEQDLQFARNVRRLQDVIIRQYTRLAKLQLSLLGVDPEPVVFRLELPKVIIVDELRKWQAEQLKQLTMRMVKQTFWPTDEWLLQAFGDMTPDEVQEMLAGQNAPDEFNGLVTTAEVGTVSQSDEVTEALVGHLKSLLPSTPESA